MKQFVAKKSCSLMGQDFSISFARRLSTQTGSLQDGMVAVDAAILLFEAVRQRQ